MDDGIEDGETLLVVHCSVIIIRVHSGYFLNLIIKGEERGTNNFISRLARIAEVSEEDDILGPGQATSGDFVGRFLDRDSLVVVVDCL